MQLETIKNNKSSFGFIRDGISGNRQTALQMVNLITNTVEYDKAFNDYVNKLLIAKSYNAYTDTTQVLSLVYEFVRKNVAYVPDKAGKIESIKSARDTLKDGYGDCDDLSILIASMLGALGFENVNLVMASYDTKANGFEHIYVEVFDRKNKRFVLDASLPQEKAQVNYEVKPIKTESVKVFNRSVSNNFLGAIHNIKLQARQFAKQGINTIPYALQFLPLGLIPANLMQQGVNLITGADINSLSLSELGSAINSQLDELILQINANQIADDLIAPYAMQIASQLSAYKVKANEVENFKTIKNSIKNKVVFIQQIAKERETVISLNPKGMLAAGTIIIGFIGYKLYKQGRF